MSLVTGEGISGTGRMSESHERLMNGHDAGGFLNPRLSMSNRASMTHARRSSAAANNEYWAAAAGQRHGRRDSGGSVLFNAYDTEESVGLTQLNEDAEEDDDDGMGRLGSHSGSNSQSPSPSPRVGRGGPRSHRRSASLKTVVGTNGKVINGSAAASTPLGGVRGGTLP